MTKSTIVVAVSVAYLAASLAIGLLPGKKSSDSATGYVAGDRTLGLLVMYFITGAMIFSAFAFLGAPGWAYSRGAAAFYIIAYGALGLVPFYFIGPRAARLGREYGFVTQAELLAKRFELPAIAGVMAAVSIVAFIPYLALQMMGAGYVLNAVTMGEVPSWAGSAAVYLVVLIYVLKSGVLGVGWTNTFQGIFMMALAWILGLYLPEQLHGGVEPMFRKIAEQRPDLLLAPGLNKAGTAPWSWGEYSSAIVVSIVGFSMWPHLFMKAYTAKSNVTLRRTVLLYPTFQIFIVPLLLIGFSGVFFEPAPARPDQILPHILMHIDIPPIVVGFFCAGALAASMSSGDAMVHAAASIGVRDGWITAGRRKMSPDHERRAIRWAVVVVMIAAYVVSVAYQGSLVILLLSSYGVIVQFAPAVVSALYWKGARGAGVLAGLVVGGLTTILLTVLPELRPLSIHAGAYGLFANVLTIAVHRLKAGPAPGDAGTAHFFSVADRED